MLSRLLAGLVVVAILAAAVGGLVLLSRGNATEKEAEETQLSPVVVVPATVAYFGEWTELLGTTQPLPNSVARISAPVEGRVLSILGDGKGRTLAEGDRVEANQVIAQLDDSVLLAYRDKLAAMLAGLEKQKQQPDQAGSAAAWQAVVQAELKAVDAYRSQFTIKTPIAGQLGMIQVTPGQAIAPGTTVAEVFNLDEINVLCYVPPHIVAGLALGQPARLSPRQPPTGEVAFIAVQAEPETGNFAVKVRFQNQGVETKLRSNSVQRIQVLTEPEKLRLIIPEDALLEDQATPVVMGVDVTKIKVVGAGKQKQKITTPLKLRPLVGARDRDRHIVEILGLYYVEHGRRVSVRDVRFITEGAQGLHEDDKLLVTGNLDVREDVVKLEETAPMIQKERTTLGAHDAVVWSLAFSPDGKTMASGGRAGAIKLWEIATGKNTATFEKHAAGVTSLAFSPDSTRLAAGTPAGLIKIWNVETGKDPLEIKGPAKNVLSLAFSPNGKILASGSFDGSVKLWDAATGNSVASLPPHKRSVTCVAFSADGKLLASSSTDKTIKVFDVESGKNLFTLEGPTGFVSAVAFSPDGKTLVSSNFSNNKDGSFTGKSEIRRWDAVSGKEISSTEGYASAGNAAFSPDAKLLARGGENTITLWDVASGKEIAILMGHTSPVTALSFSADSKTLASGSADKTVRLWDMPGGQ